MRDNVCIREPQQGELGFAINTAAWSWRSRVKRGSIHKPFTNHLDLSRVDASPAVLSIVDADQMDQTTKQVNDEGHVFTRGEITRDL